ncbi:MAG TPA: YggS family pyridoxal phosphate-dependent enzyme [Chitinophagaceae bacterium]|nr:YggS family pyridoxal phosphate-dependent enzyme [Chitinophagaceae bacterium]
MPVNTAKYKSIINELADKQAILVAVSKTKPVEDIFELYNLGHRDFGENYVQELVDKSVILPADIRWHFIGHLQSNKVKYIAPFVHLIHGVDSFKLLKEISKQGEKAGRRIDCLLQVHIAQEESKFGFNEEELILAMDQVNSLNMTHVRICGLMGMASFTTDMNVVRTEFKQLKKIFEDTRTRLPVSQHPMEILSMGMSSDYKIALDEGTTMVRIGSLLFGEREKKG